MDGKNLLCQRELKILNLHDTVSLHDSYSSSFYSFSIIIHKIPKEWIKELLEAKVSIPVHNFIINDPEDLVCVEEDAIKICYKYLNITDKNWWPALLGKSEIMDTVLSEELKKCNK